MFCDESVNLFTTVAAFTWAFFKPYWEGIVLICLLSRNQAKLFRVVKTKHLWEYILDVVLVGNLVYDSEKLFTSVMLVAHVCCEFDIKFWRRTSFHLQAEYAQFPLEVISNVNGFRLWSMPLFDDGKGYVKIRISLTALCLCQRHNFLGMLSFFESF